MSRLFLPGLTGSSNQKDQTLERNSEILFQFTRPSYRSLTGIFLGQGWKIYGVKHQRSWKLLHCSSCITATHWNATQRFHWFFCFIGCKNRDLEISHMGPWLKSYFISLCSFVTSFHWFHWLYCFCCSRAPAEGSRDTFLLKKIISQTMTHAGDHSQGERRKKRE